MLILSDLLYTDNLRIIVKATGWREGVEIGNALAEGKTAEEAEDKAIRRLKDRFRKETNSIENLSIIKEQAIETDISSENKNRNQNSINNIDLENLKTKKTEAPSDWSQDLNRYELEIKRLGFNKAEENLLIKELIGYNSRNMIIDYDDLLLMIKIIKTTKDNKSVIQIKEFYSKDNLIKETNHILSELKWNTEKARKVVYDFYKVKSRNKLSQKQLIEFYFFLLQKAA